MARKPGLALAPVDAEVLGQEAGDHHAQAVVHPPAVQQLPHGRIHQRIAGAPLLPGSEPFRPVLPDQGIELGLERPLHDVRKTVEDHEIEIAPDQFVEPAVRPPGQRLAHQFADREGPEAQMHGQIGNAAHGRIVAQLAVLGQAPVAELRPHGPRTLHAGHDAQGLQIGAFKAEGGERGHAGGKIGGRGHQRPLARVPRVIGHGQPLQPGIFVGSEHAERPSRLGQDLIAIEDDLIAQQFEPDAMGRQGSRNLGIATLCRRFIIAMGINVADAEPDGELGNRLERPAVPDDQAAPAGAQGLIQLHQRAMDELDAPIPAVRQGIQDVPVEHEDAIDPGVLLQRGSQGGMIVVAQVAAEPDQGGRRRGRRHEDPFFG